MVHRVHRLRKGPESPTYPTNSAYFTDPQRAREPPRTTRYQSFCHVPYVLVAPCTPRTSQIPYEFPTYPSYSQVLGMYSMFIV